MKFYLHALHADWIPLVLEHNTGGALVEFGRLDRPFLFDRTYVFPRGYEPRHAGAVDSAVDVFARSVELAYRADDEDELLGSVADLVARSPVSDGATTVDDVLDHVETELGSRLVPTYSGVIADGLEQFEVVGRCVSWTTADDLRAGIDVVP